MKYWKLFAAFVALCLCAAASAQDLKPVRDRDSKLFGYQDKSKNWVIPPAFQSAKRFNGGFAIVEQSGLKGLIDQTGAWVLKPEYDNIGKFDKSGLCEVTVKADRVKRRGLADQSGRLVIPVECYSISVDRREGLILAEKDVEVERLGVRPMWGVYDMQGEEIFAPQFSSAPSFSEGRGTATSAYNSLKGIISTDGQTLLPFNNLAISSRYGGYSVLTSDFVREVYDSRLLKTEDYAYAGYVRPYDPAGDPVRAAAWRVGAVGHRLSRNNLKEVRMNDGYRNRSANCSDLRLDWGYDRFVRLEPAVDEGGHPGSMLEPNSGLYYTVKAILYEKDGTPVGEVSRWGWFEGECEEGIIYNAEGAGLWMAMRDLNCPAVPAFSTSITGYRTIDHGSVLSGLGLSSYELDKMYNPETAGERYVEIITGENLGITAMQERPAPDLRAMRALDQAMRLPIFRRRFYMGQVVNCKTSPVEGGLELELSDRLVCRVADNFEEPSFSMKGEEEIFWGPGNARTVGLSLESVRPDPACTADDLYDSGCSFIVVLNLYEEDGTFLRTLGTAPALDFATDGALVFEALGIALLPEPYEAPASDNRRSSLGRWSSDDFRAPAGERAFRKQVINGAQRLPATLSALKGAGETLRSVRPAYNRGGYGGRNSYDGRGNYDQRGYEGQGGYDNRSDSRSVHQNGGSYQRGNNARQR